MSSLVECFSIIRAPCQESKMDHELIDILILCVLAVICGAKGWQDIEEVGHSRLEWLQERGFLKKGISVDDTIARIISGLNPEELQHIDGNKIYFVVQFKDTTEELKEES